MQLPNRKDSSQICPVTLSEITEPSNAEGETGLIGDSKLGYDGLNEVIKEIDIDGEQQCSEVEYFCIIISSDQVLVCWNLLSSATSHPGSSRKKMRTCY